jgi:hypothetical protein
LSDEQADLWGVRTEAGAGVWTSEGWGSIMVAGNERGRIGPAARARQGESEGGGWEECQG